MNNTKRKKLSGRVTFFLFTLIPVVLYTFFYVVSVINGIRYSFTDWDGMAQKMNFIGWKNYKILLKNPNFWNAIKTTVIYSVLLVIGVIVISLILSISLNSLKKFKTLVKSVYFVPAMIGGVTIAGLQQIPEEQYESAKIDGATAFQRFRYVTFPYLLPTVTVNLILTIKQGFTSFDFPYALTGGGPVRATEVIGILIYNDAFKNMRFSMANAEACILFVIVAIFSLTQLKLTSKGGTD